MDLKNEKLSIVSKISLCNKSKKLCNIAQRMVLSAQSTIQSNHKLLVHQPETTLNKIMAICAITQT